MKASTFRSYTSLLLRFIFLTFFSSLIFLSCSEEEDDPAIPAQTTYNFPPEVLDSIFTLDRPNEIRNLDESLNDMVQKGMVIHQGTTPPEIFHEKGSEKFGVKFHIENNCIFDYKIAENANTVYGKYEETLRIFKDPQKRFVAEASFSSIGDPKFPDYPTGLDRGSGKGFVSGDGNKFTLFYKVKNGFFGDIPYQALWIISGTVSVDQEVTDVTKCLVMLQKGNDPDDKVANRGTIRIFKDTSPELIQPEVVIDALNPGSGFVGTPVMITGSGFSANAGTNTVLFGTVPATVTAASQTQLTVTAPAGAAPPPGGEVAVTVQVKAKTSNSLTFRYQNQAPTVAITSPANNAPFPTSASIPIEATATDADGTVAKVEFFQNTTLLGEDTSSPYTFTWSSVPSGNYSLTARATDNAGATTTSAAVNVRVNQAPTVAITSPTNNARIVNPASISIAAHAADADGTVAMVEFFQGSTKLGEDVTSSYTFNWPKVAAGTYTLTARATDNAGAVTISAPVNVTVEYTNITRLSPDIGAPGILVTIMGSGFSTTRTENTVRFGDRTATVTAASPTQLTVRVPQGPPGGGPVQVTVQVGSTRSNSIPFDYLYISTIEGSFKCAGDSIASINYGRGNNTITIIGSGFSPIAGENIILFRDTKATPRSATSTRLEVVVPRILFPNERYPIVIRVSVIVRGKGITSQRFLHWDFCPIE